MGRIVYVSHDWVTYCIYVQENLEGHNIIGIT